MNQHTVLILCLVIFFCSERVQAQTEDTKRSYTVNECFELARKNYPEHERIDLIQQTQNIQLENTKRGNLPRINLNGFASYQSDVAGIEGSTMIPSLSKDQYKLTLDLDHSLTQYRIAKQQKRLDLAEAESQRKEVEVHLYQLRSRVEQIYFNSLLLEAQIEQVKIKRKDLERGQKQSEAAHANGIGLKSDIALLKAEIVGVDQILIEMRSSMENLLEVLSYFTGESITNTRQLINQTAVANFGTNNRPELTLFESQQLMYEIRKDLLTERNLPSVSLFGQVGYGRPSLNFLKNEFDDFYKVGIKFNWNISNYYTSKNEKQMLHLAGKQIETQKRNFLFNSNIETTTSRNKINELTQLMIKDEEIIVLRDEVQKASQAQLKQGVITALDYLKHVNAEDLANQNLIYHRTQKALEQQKLVTLLGQY